MTETVSQQPKRPLLKGIFHLLATIVYILALPFLIQQIPPTLECPLIVYLLSIIGNFGSSALFHVIRWPKHLVIYPRRLDHVMIFIKIAATYYAAIATIFSGISSLVIYVLAIGTILGITIRIFYTKAPKIVIGLPYMIIGWAILLDPYIILKVMDRIPDGALIAILAGISYTVGAFVYIAKYPRGYLPYMGYHELFHIFTIIGAVLFTVCIFGYGIPYHLNLQS